MYKSKQNASDGFKLLGRVVTLRSDQRGSVTLLAGMMMFLVTMLSVIALDTNMAIYNRIVAQNAVDSAADSAALWQARGCNMLQQLNNLHYTVDEALIAAEIVAGAGCITATVCLALEAIPFVGEAAYVAQQIACAICDFLPAIDFVQHTFYDILMPIQQAIVDITPFLAFGYANACAQGSGADPVIAVVPDYLNDAVGMLSGIPGLSDLSSVAGGALTTVAGIGSEIPIYAAPLDPTSLELYVSTNDNNGLPLDWPQEVPETFAGFGMVGCSDFYVPFSDACSMVSYDEDGVSGDTSREDSSESDKPAWGWNDQYYFGWPGFMTWIAGKTNRAELAGLGNLMWLNGTNSSTILTNQMYTGSSFSSTNLSIPAFLAVASSQVEGTTVVCNGSVNAQGRIIQVYISSNSPGTNYWIYH